MMLFLPMEVSLQDIAEDEEACMKRRDFLKFAGVAPFILAWGEMEVDMDKYDYLVKDLGHPGSNWLRVQKRLKQAGQEGWRLVALVDGWGYFIRPKPESEGTVDY